MPKQFTLNIFPKFLMGQEVYHCSKYLAKVKENYSKHYIYAYEIILTRTSMDIFIRLDNRIV